MTILGTKKNKKFHIQLLRFQNFQVNHASRFSLGVSLISGIALCYSMQRAVTPQFDCLGNLAQEGNGLNYYQLLRVNWPNEIIEWHNYYNQLTTVWE